MFTKTFKSLSQDQDRWLDICCLFGLGIGILLRLSQYLSNRSLWFDEVALGLNLLDRGYFELLDALDYNQAAPPLFLWIEKLALETWGSHEYALRLFPLLGGLLSLGLFYQVTRQFASGWSRPIAILLFSVQGYIAYFASETKPYSWDVAISLLLFTALTSINTLKPSHKQLFIAGILSIFSIWLSFPSIFILASVEAVNLLKLQPWKTSWQSLQTFLRRRIPLYSAWLISFGGLYFGIIRKTLSDTGLADSWAGRYPDNFWDIGWLLDSFGRFFYRPLGFPGPADGVAIVAFITGCILLYRTAKLRLLYLSSPLIISLLAAFLHKYPFRERLILFLTPFALILLAEGIVFWLERWRKQPRMLSLISILMATTLILMPLWRGLHGTIVPTSSHFDHVRPTIEYIDTHWQSGDKLYVLPGAQLQFEFYNRRIELPKSEIILSQLQNIGIWKVSDDDLEKHYQELDRLKTTELQNQDRVWVLLARKQPQSEEAIVEQLNRLGTMKERKQYPGAMVGLYDFSS
ncbi:membrane protein [Leptolyngbya sp. Heron Island J]|uniref:hypothetical protein n=1 Tax=Leptolyngbya sp. Heron Island J TaxID=1385935 RepID=UPI0003B9A84F|nr:hypothetical protein [Leptolyngbya sp. Heron Island J]ESA32072.1 membrane protein [Leptolyngbya sp. Heron Island J]